jgi:hypothetical protein
MPAALLALGLLAAAAQDKTYDLKLDALPKPGQMFQVDASRHMKMGLQANGQPAGAQEDKKLFAGTEEVVSVGPDGAQELRWTFTKAQRLEEDAMKPYGFHGKTIRVKKARKAAATYAYDDGGPVSEEDLKGLQESFDGDGKGDASKAFAPPKPVKVGESWEPDPVAVASTFEEGMAGAVDPAKSKVRFTLVSVETRGGAEFGKIEGTLTLALNAMGPMKLETPMLLKMSVELDVCIDGSAPAGVMKMKGELKGASDVDAQGQKVRLDIDLTMVGVKSKALLK